MRFRTYFAPAVVFFVTLSIYIHNLSRSVYGGDVGDLVTAAYVGGVAHPPGYPLFTFLGFLLTRVHTFPSPAFAVGLISVASGAFGVLLAYLTIRLLVKNSLISIITTGILAFSYFFWFYSEIAEVFALNAFFLILLLYLALRIYIQNATKLFPVFFFSLGLSLTNHQTIIFAFPSLFLLITPAYFKSQEKIKILLLGLLALLGGFAAYLYVPIASAHNPVLNWDSVHDISSFFHLLLRKDYGTFSPGLFPTPSFLQRLLIVKEYLNQIATQLTLPSIALCVIGSVYAFVKQRLLALSLFLGFFLSGPLFTYYAGFPLTGNFYFGVNERFFILSTIFLLYFLPFGLLFCSKLFTKLSRVPVSVFQSIFIIIPLMLLYYNFPKTNLSTIFIGDYYGEDMLTTLPQNSLLFVAGDTIIFNTWYTHYEKNVRPDVQVLNINGNVGSPYYAVLQHDYKVTHPHATARQLQESIVENLPQNGSVFSIEELEPVSGKKFTWIPYGLTFQLIAPNAYPTEASYTTSEQVVWSHIHVPQIQQGKQALALGNVTIADIPNSYANAMLLIGNFYLSQYHDKKMAKSWLDRAAKVAPGYEKTYSALGAYYLTITNECLLAQENFSKAIVINPVEPLNYFLLYATDNGCLHNSEQANDVKKLFEKEFHTNFSKAFSQYLSK